MQLLLTNFSVAAGISYLGRSSDSSSDDHSHSEGMSIRKIGLGVGLWTLITVTLALFFACYLAVKLSLLTDSGLGAIIGLVIWAAYFCLLVWVSSSTVGSLIGSVVNAATSGFQAVLGAATAAIGGQAAKRQVVSTAEAVAAAVRNELGSAMDPASIRESIEDYVQRLRLPGLDLGRLRSDFEAILNDPEIAELADEGGLAQIDRDTFVDLVSKRTDFTKDEVNRIADLLESVWRQTLGKRSPRRDSTAELIEYLQLTQPGQLQIRELNAKIDRLLAERSQQRTSGDQQKSPGLLQQSVQAGMSTLLGLIAGRTDLSDLDLERILDRLKGGSDQVARQANQVMAQLQGETPQEQAYSLIRYDVEQYLLNQASWQMSPAIVEREFREVLYDPAADPDSIVQQLSYLKRSYFVDVLSSRGVFTQSKIQQIADQLEAIRKDVLVGAQAAKELEIAADLQQRIKIYLTLTPPSQLHSSDTLPEFQALLSDEDADYDTLNQRLSVYDRSTLKNLLLQRTDMAPEEVESILDALERTRDRVLFDAKSLNEQISQRATDVQQRLENYLRNTGKSELNPEGIKRDLQLLFNDPQLGIGALRYRFSQFDRDTAVQLLRQREDISEAEANQIVDHVEFNWNSVIHAPQMLAGTVQEAYEQTLIKIADYLCGTNLEELDPEGIQRDLRTLLADPQEGTIALRQRLSRIDRETLVKLLSQRPDLSEEQVNQTIDQVLGAIRQIIRAPRRLALRTQQQVMDFEASLEDYLRHTDKEELNPEGIKRDLGLLVQSPKLGLQHLSDRLAQVDRSTLIALLSQRKDMTPEEAERIVSQVESVRDQLVNQMRQIQYRIQELIDRLFARIRNYLNSLDRPELNYDSIKHDVRLLFDDPQAGFDAIRERLGQFDRGTLVAILSSRKDISEEQANHIIDQIESARNSVLQRAERIQLEAQRRVEEIKHQAQRQMEETRKAAATAAWWLFVTALTSAAAAAGSGALGAG
ncbi:MFS transporter [Leptodesmis sichuanensis]|uniref:MFS transporter n=1 Tax=Leptodesmis sichuanensis TaxID=2906798 RepID=UPI001F23AEB6|nr:MFS transporter [Leptodesmis sichuanensis]UIE40150.1 MFS transporter [Leptodesmis sichuanensis A121]